MPDHSQSIAQAYRQMLEDSRLMPDPAQAEAVKRLEEIQKDWSKLSPKKRFLGLLGRNDAPTGMQGVYLWGEVGRGKSLLMDMLYDTTDIVPKRRVHYHAFMIDVHARIHRWRTKGKGADRDPIPPLAAALAVEAKLLCLDELQVTDVADATAAIGQMEGAITHPVCSGAERPPLRRLRLDTISQQERTKEEDRSQAEE